MIHMAWGLGFLISVVTQGRFPYRAEQPSVPGIGSGAPEALRKSVGPQSDGLLDELRIRDPSADPG
ncbi:MAG: hypothetical protein H0U69_05055 [Trueperaceae bacterium]|nr:hypothetical protein [Trueperaceae bacterium]